jgi:hypothetical protein
VEYLDGRRGDDSAEFLGSSPFCMRSQTLSQAPVQPQGPILEAKGFSAAEGTLLEIGFRLRRRILKSAVVAKFSGCSTESEFLNSGITIFSSHKSQYRMHRRGGNFLQSCH